MQHSSEDHLCVPNALSPNRRAARRLASTRTAALLSPRSVCAQETKTVRVTARGYAGPITFGADA